MKKDLLSKPHWNVSDLMEYVGCKKTKAYEIMKICKKKYGGAIRFERSYITRDSVLAYLGTSIERETYVKDTIERYL